jgi:hypothetical protein
MRWKGKFLAAFVFALIPFVLGVYGHGGSLWYLGFPALILLAFLGIRQATRGYRGEYSATMLALNAVALLVLYDAAYITGWGGGVLCREVHCRKICARFEPVVSALERYRSQHGQYPRSLNQVPGASESLAASGIEVAEGRLLPGGLDVSQADRADALVYLDPQEYLFLVPVEQPMPMCLTRFHSYMRGGRESSWTRERLIWMLRAR